MNLGSAIIYYFYKKLLIKNKKYNKNRKYIKYINLVYEIPLLVCDVSFNMRVIF